jgi:hypothetical protein
MWITPIAAFAASEKAESPSKKQPRSVEKELFVGTRNVSDTVGHRRPNHVGTQPMVEWIR